MLGCVDLRCEPLFPTYAAIRPAGDAAVRVKLCKVFRSRQCDTRYVPGTSACATRRPGSPSAGLPLAGAEGTGRPQPGHSARAASGFLGRDGAPGQAAWAPPLRARLPPQPSPLCAKAPLQAGLLPGHAEFTPGHAPETVPARGARQTRGPGGKPRQRPFSTVFRTLGVPRVCWAPERHTCLV